MHFGDADMPRNSILSKEMYICLEIYVNWLYKLFLQNTAQLAT